MNGNTPYAGRPNAVQAGRPESLEPDLSAEQRRDLQRDVATIASRTREYLPNEYAVGSELRQGASGTEAHVAVRPPIGNPVSAGFRPETGEDGAALDEADRDEVAQGLAASAALQVKQALEGQDRDAVAR